MVAQEVVAVAGFVWQRLLLAVLEMHDALWAAMVEREVEGETQLSRVERY